MSFTGGKLKLKGGGEPPGIKKKKKKKSVDSKAVALAETEGKDAEQLDKKAELAKVIHGYEIAERGEEEDRRTATEKRRDEKMAKVEEERLRRMAQKTHRERINEFNTYLTELSEHHDIPKVGPG